MGSLVVAFNWISKRIIYRFNIACFGAGYISFIHKRRGKSPVRFVLESRLWSVLDKATGFNQHELLSMWSIQATLSTQGPHIISHRTQPSELFEFGIRSILLMIFQSQLKFDGKVALTQIPINLSLRNIAHDNYIVAWATLCNDIVTRVRILVMTALHLISITMARSWVI